MTKALGGDPISPIDLWIEAVSPVTGGPSGPTEWRLAEVPGAPTAILDPGAVAAPPSGEPDAERLRRFVAELGWRGLERLRTAEASRPFVWRIRCADARILGLPWHALLPERGEHIEIQRVAIRPRGTRIVLDGALDPAFADALESRFGTSVVRPASDDWGDVVKVISQQSVQTCLHVVYRFDGTHWLRGSGQGTASREWTVDRVRELVPVAHRIRLVVLDLRPSAGAKPQDVDVTPLLRALWEAGIPHVIASRHPLTTDEALAFAETLYEALHDGESTVEAISAARRAFSTPETRRSVELSSLEDIDQPPRLLRLPPEPPSRRRTLGAALALAVASAGLGVGGGWMAAGLFAEAGAEASSPQPTQVDLGPMPPSPERIVIDDIERAQKQVAEHTGVEQNPNPLTTFHRDLQYADEHGDLARARQAIRELRAVLSRQPVPGTLQTGIPAGRAVLRAVETLAVCSGENAAGQADDVCLRLMLLISLEGTARALATRDAVLRRASADVLYLLGAAALATNEPDAIEQHGRRIEEALRVDPSHVASMLSMGHIMLERGKLDAAEQWFRRALALEPGSPQAVAGLQSVTHRRRE